MSKTKEKYYCKDCNEGKSPKGLRCSDCYHKNTIKFKKIKVICPCGKEFITTENRIKEGRGIYCLRKCFVIYRPTPWLKKTQFIKGQIAPNKGKKIIALSLENHPNWAGGKTKQNQGYINHRLSGKYILEHRYFIEQQLERKLLSDEVVHHINGNRKDNNLENLMIFPNQSAHIKYHWVNTNSFINRRPKIR